MRALRLHGRGDVRLDDLPAPTAGPGHVLVRVAWAGMCGTDLHELEHGPVFCPAPGHAHPLTGETLPVVLGHEFSGTVVEVGEGADPALLGKAVAVEPTWGCGTCAACVRGMYNLCERVAVVGLSGGGGGLSEYVAVRADKAHPLGDVPLDAGALVEPLSVAFHAAHLAGVQPGHSAVIYGAGPVGLLLLSVLRSLGADPVTVVDPIESRLAKATELGASLVLTPAAAQAGALHAASADFAFECSGHQSALSSAVDAVVAGGTVVNIGVWSGDGCVDMNAALLKEVQMLWSFSFRSDFPRVIELLRSGRIDVSSLITARVALDDAATIGFEMLRTGEQVKVLIAVDG